MLRKPPSFILFLVRDNDLDDERNQLFSQKDRVTDLLSFAAWRGCEIEANYFETLFRPWYSLSSRGAILGNVHHSQSSSAVTTHSHPPLSPLTVNLILH
jgi:ssRNA-specific RNase YbeY (16S rRNA maturation enzyme)